MLTVNRSGVQAKATEEPFPAVHAMIHLCASLVRTFEIFDHTDLIRLAIKLRAKGKSKYYCVSRASYMTVLRQSRGT